MFNKKLLSVLAYVIAVLLLVKAAYVLVNFGWSYFGAPPQEVFGQQAFDPVNYPFISYLLLLQDLATVSFIYLIVGALKSLVVCGCTLSGSKAAAPKAMMSEPKSVSAPAAKKKPARRRVAKKK